MLFKPWTEQEIKEKYKNNIGKMPDDVIIYHKDPYNFKSTHKSVFHYIQEDFGSKKAFKSFWQGTFFAYFLYGLLPMVCTHFSMHTLFVTAAIMLTIFTLTDILCRTAYASVVAGLTLETMLFLAYTWFQTPPSLLNGIGWLVMYLIFNYFDTTYSLQSSIADRMGWNFIFCYLPLVLPDKYLFVGTIALFIYFFVSSLICHYTIGHKLKKINFPVFVQIWIAFIVICLVGRVL